MKPPVDLSRVRRIWLRTPNWLGDFVMATATFERVRRAFPAAHITGGMRPYLTGLLAGTEFFDTVVPTPKAGGLGGLRAQVKAMRAADYDLAIVLPNSLATGLVPFLARVPLRLGYRQGRGLLMNLGPAAQVRRRWWQPRQGPRRWPSPMPNYYHDLLDTLGLPPGGLHPVLPVRPADVAWVDAHLQSRGIAPGTRLLLLVVGANFGASKLWPPERFAAVAQRFQRELGLRALVLVGPAEVELGERIAAEGGAICLSQPVLDLGQLKALVARGALMITGDTGPRHLAVAYDRPVVCLMGPNDPNYTNYCMEHTVLIRKDLPCSPCQRKVCPLGHHRCMRDITVDEVFAAGQGLLQRSPTAAIP
ncbi:MAG: lipopolysaccharide heptosyltransferase II [Planctomycetes bacterium]|nr:lipopolysaccharide heptosyltransferase II [Planctomycetota bacterium]